MPVNHSLKLRATLWVAISCLLLGLTSCVKYRSLVYLQTDTGIQNRSNISNARALKAYIIQPRDVLSVRFTSPGMTNEDAMTFNAGALGQGGQVNPAMLYVNGYSVNDSGTITLPIVGQITVAGRSVAQAQEEIQRRAAPFFKETTTTVRLVSFRVSVLGEVNRPGLFHIYNDQITLFQALALAGDLSVYGSRNKVRILRESPQSTEVMIADLNDPQIITRPYYFLQPNDVIYVEPARSRPARDNVPIISLVLSGVTATVLTLNFVLRNFN